MLVWFMSDELKERVGYMMDSDKYHNLFTEMTWDEKAAIYLYTDNTAHYLNRYLRGEWVPPEEFLQQLELYSDLLSSALGKAIAKYTGIAYRGLALPREEINEFANIMAAGLTKVLDAFTSATDNEPSAYNFACMAAAQKDKFPVILSIHSKHGVDITELSVYSFEREILFDKGLELSITQVEVEDNIYYIEATEA